MKINSFVIKLLLICLTVFGLTLQSEAKSQKSVAELLQMVNLSSRGAGLNMGKKSSSVKLPKSEIKFNQEKNLDEVKPPKSSSLFKRKSNSVRSQLEATLDKQINELFRLTNKFKNSPSRGEMWLRLSELYIEKAGMVQDRIQDEYDANIERYKSGKTKKKPILNLSKAYEYNKKAIQLNEWFLKDFPKDPKVHQALYFLGYNYFEIGNTSKGQSYYEKLVKQFPRSSFVGESHFALGEYYFENEKWKQAYKEYSYLIKENSHRLHEFAMYKGAWCLYRLGKGKDALKYLEYIIGSSKSDDQTITGNRSLSRLRLEKEAIADLTTFYVISGDPEKAADYFEKMVGDKYPQYIEKLAYYYSDKGNREAAKSIFKKLIEINPTDPKTFDYQYQIVKNYYFTKNTKEFIQETKNWVSNFSEGTAWYKVNNANKELIDKSQKLIEQTYRNYVLQQHQTAQNSKASYSQKSAKEAYEFYFKSFSSSPVYADMKFYYGELLYDMEEYNLATEQYRWVIDNAANSGFYPKAAQNILLSSEKSLPSDKFLQKQAGDSLDPLPLDDKVKNFVEVGNWYVEKFPNSEKELEILFRMSRLLYQSNHFDDAEEGFQKITKKYPKSKYAEYSANLLLDIYNLKKDYIGLEKAGKKLLENETLAQTKTGQDIKNIVEQAAFKKAQEFEAKGDFESSAVAYMEFGYANANSDLAGTALYNAGVNFEKAEKYSEAIKAYEKIQISRNPKDDKLKDETKGLLASVYMKTSNFPLAAKIYTELAKDDNKDKTQLDIIFNAALLNELLGKKYLAIKYYLLYLEKAKRSSDKSKAMFALAELYRKSKNYKEATKYYQNYADLGSSNANEVMQSFWWLYDISKKTKKLQDTETWTKRIKSYQKRYNLDIGKVYLAKLKYEESENIYRDFISIKFSKDPEKQKKQVDEKVSFLNKLNKNLSAIIELDSAEEIISALSMLGKANEQMYKSIVDAPIPTGLSEEEVHQYMDGIEGIAKPFKDKSVEAFRSAVEKGWDLDVYSRDYFYAYEKMQTIEPDKFYPTKPATFDVHMIHLMDKESEPTEETLKVATNQLMEKPNDYKALNSMAMYYFNNKHFEMAQYLINKALKLEKESSELHNNLGMILWSQGEQRDAILNWKKAIQINSSDAVASLNLGSSYSNSANYTKAVIALEKAIKNGVKDYRAYNNYGVALMVTGKFDEAERYFNKMSDKDSERSEVLINKAQLFIKHKKSFSSGMDAINRLKFVGIPAEYKKMIIDLEKEAKAGLK